MNYLADNRLVTKLFLWLEHEFTGRKVRGSNPASASRIPLSRLVAVSQPSCFLLMALQLSTERALQLNDFLFSWGVRCNHRLTSSCKSAVYAGILLLRHPTS
ncbi:hypothetical protein CSKR_108454 [Clonorchis sinensis]|uniref:Uncharacterized protein n=1 Tax=Clonorchis sinensis TaxID=79923 RepID=A0A419PID4_CLOSI|nr:hypothetical protein CSKR_108454 [Clonorchis sinensis]